MWCCISNISLQDPFEIYSFLLCVCFVYLLFSFICLNTEIFRRHKYQNFPISVLWILYSEEFLADWIVKYSIIVGENYFSKNLLFTITQLQKKTHKYGFNKRLKKGEFYLKFNHKTSISILYGISQHTILTYVEYWLANAAFIEDIFDNLTLYDQQLHVRRTILWLG